MAYVVDAQGGQLADLCGFALVLPFSFDAVGRVGLDWPSTLLVLHLELSRHNSAAFPSPQSSIPIQPNTVSVRQQGYGPLLTCSKFDRVLYMGTHAVSAGDSVVVLRGRADVTTGLTVSLPKDPPLGWMGQDDAGSKFGWGGELKAGAQPLMKVGYVEGVLDQATSSVREFCAFGLCTDATSVVQHVLDAGAAMTDLPPNGPSVTFAQPIPQVEFSDLRRTNAPAWSFLGATPQAANQVVKSQGAIVLCQGSWARAADSRPFRALAQAAVSNDSRSLQDAARWSIISQPFETALDLPEDRGFQRTYQPVIQGVLLWNLGRRRDAGGAQPAKPILL